MAIPELLPVVILTLLLQQHAPARVMKLSVVKDDEPWITDEVRPHVIVARGISELIHDEIVRLRSLSPHKIKRAEKWDCRMRRTKHLGATVHESVDLMSSG